MSDWRPAQFRSLWERADAIVALLPGRVSRRVRVQIHRAILSELVQAWNRGADSGICFGTDAHIPNNWVPDSRAV